jgi:hypothetical protein
VPHNETDTTVGNMSSPVSNSLEASIHVVGRTTNFIKTFMSECYLKMRIPTNSLHHSVFKRESNTHRLLSKNVKVRIYKTIILPVVLYGCETWSLRVREEHKLRAFENRVVRRICGAKRDGVTGEWRKLHYEELHNLYSSPSIIRIIKSRRMRWAGHVARMGEKRNV